MITPKHPVPCPICGIEHSGPCPWDPQDLCPECGEEDCLCDLGEINDVLEDEDE